MMQSTWTVLRGGSIVDGTGAPPFPGEVVIADERIVFAGEVEGAKAAYPLDERTRVIDCEGSIVAPGFIDAHSHSDLQVIQNRTEKLLQGVTTEVVGNCGFSAYPLTEPPETLRDFANGIFCAHGEWGWNSAAAYLAAARQSETATVASLVGHGSLRTKVAGSTSRALTARELDRMTGLLDESLQEGAAGLSSGLMYAPGSGASPEEMIALCRVVARRGGVYATHMRSYSAGLVEAVEEQISVAEASGCRLQISHLQAAGENYWKLLQPALAAIEQASTRGVDIAFDAYPWLAGSTVLTQVLPQDALDGGVPQLLVRLRDPLQRESIRTRIKPEARWTGVVITSVARNEAALVGRSIQEIADERGDQPANVVMDILLEQEGSVLIVEHCQSLENLRTALTHPLAIVITDGVYTTGRSHPRLYATFPVLLGDIVRERRWLSIEEAVHKVSGKPATRFNLVDRGRIAAGFIGDIAVFDPQTVRSEATYENPAVAPAGLRAVLRNGRVLVDAGAVQ